MHQFKQYKKFVVGLLLVTGVSACAAPAGQSSTANSTPAATVAPADSGVTTQETVTATVAAGSDQTTGSGSSSSESATTGAKLNLNTATEEEFLAAIPNLGEQMVDEFMEYRPYVSIQQFRQEIGKYVDEAQVASYEQYVYVPIDVNEADAATLRQIPGVDEAAAAALIAARPYESNSAFLDQLAELAPSGDRTGAESYLAAQ